MKMSLPGELSAGVAEFSISVIDGNPSFERFVKLDLCPGEAEALRVGRDLETASVPLHDVVVADRALVMKAADAIQILRSGTPGFFRLAGRTAEAPVVVGQEAAEDFVGRFHFGCTGEAEFAGEAILKGAPQAFDAALGLRGLGGDVGDAELLQSAAELGRLAATSELFFDRPVIVVADEDAMAVAVEAERDAEV